jgi:hypothetical protein
MRKKLLSGISFFLAAIVSLLCTCKELPTNPYDDDKNLKITMFISGDLLEINALDSVSVGLVVSIPSLVKKLTVVQGDDLKELAVPLNRPESSQPDTVYFRTMYKQAGKKELTVNAALSDNLKKTFPLSIRVLSSSGSLWKQDTMTILVQEDTTISYPLLSLLKDPSATNVVFTSSDTGINGTNWKYTIPRGAVSKDTISLFASNDGSKLSVLKVILLVSSKNAEGTVIKLSSPALDRSNVAQSTVRLVVICKDENGISAVNYTFGSISGEMSKVNDSTYSVVLENLIKGDNKVTVIATDASSKKKAIDTVFTIIYDPTMSKNIAPKFDTDTIRATVITGSQYFLNLKEICFDPNGDALSYSLVAPSKGTITTMTYGYTPSDSETGNQTVTIITRDFALADTLTIIFTVKRDDTDPPSVTFTPSLGDTLFSSDTTYTIPLKALDASGIDRVEAASDTKNPSNVIKVNDSVWNIKVSSLGSGNAVPVIITIYDKSPRANIFKDTAIIRYKPADKDKPEIQITSQAKDTAIINNSTCEVTLKCKDVSGIQSVTASNGTTAINVAGVTDSVFSATITNVPSDRYMPVTFTVTDKSTNTNVNTKTIYLKYDPTGTDLTAPSITLKNPAADNTVIGTSSVTVDILCTDDNGVASLICEFGGKTYSATKGNNNIFSVTIPGLVKGANVLKVTATDGSTNANGKSTSFTVNYDPTLLDLTGPKITLPTWLTDDITVESSSLSFTAECSDVNQVAGVQCSFGGKSFSVTNTGDVYSVTVTGLNSGMTNVITLTATDGSTNANKTVKTISVKYDPTLNDKTGPTITLVNPTSETAIINTSSINLEIICKDLNKVGSVSYSFNSETKAMTPGANDTYTATIAGLSSTSVNKIEITAIDGSTNKNKAVKTVSVSCKTTSGYDTTTIQPDQSTSQDAVILTARQTSTNRYNYFNLNYGTRECISIGQYDTFTVCRGLIKFNIPSINPDSIINATLTLSTQSWLSTGLPANEFTLNLHKILLSWLPGKFGTIQSCMVTGEVNSAIVNGVTGNERFWGNQDGTEDWNETGIGQNNKDAEATPCASSTKSSQDLNPWQFDITSVCKQWLRDPSTNNGLLMKGSNDLTADPKEKKPYMPVVWSGECSESSFRPKLVIIYKK